MHLRLIPILSVDLKRIPKFVCDWKFAARLLALRVTQTSGCVLDPSGPSTVKDVGQLAKQWQLLLGFMPQQPPQVGGFIGGWGGVRSGCKPSIPLREKGLAPGPSWQWGPCQRAARSGVQDKQAQQPCGVSCRMEHVHRGGGEEGWGWGGGMLQ